MDIEELELDCELVDMLLDDDDALLVEIDELELD